MSTLTAAQSPTLEGLRQALYEAPSAQTWAALCALVDAWQEEALWPLALDYAAQHLARWPAALREAPAPWWRAARDAEAPRGWPLARALALNVFTAREAGALARAIETNALQDITYLKVRGQAQHALGPLSAPGGPLPVRGLELVSVESGFLAELARRAPWWEGLEVLAQRAQGELSAWSQGEGPPLPGGLVELRLEGSGRRGGALVEALLQRSLPPGLSSLGLVNLGLTAREVAMLVMAPWRGQLRALDLSGNGLGAEAAQALALLREAPALSRLTLLDHQLGWQEAQRLRRSLPGVLLELDRFPGPERMTY